MHLREAIEGYLLDAQARRLSPNTIADYQTLFHKLTAFLGDSTTFESIEIDHLRQFLGSLPGSGKTILNVHIALSALWTWAVGEHVVAQNIVRGIKRPSPDSRAINPFTESDIRAMLRASVKTTYVRQGRCPTCCPMQRGIGLSCCSCWTLA